MLFLGVYECTSCRILSCAEELSGSIELDEATSMEFATHISSVREVLNDLASSRERNL